VTETTETPGQAEAGQPEPPAAGQGINLEPVKKKLPPLPFELLSLEKGEGAEVKVKVRVTAEDFEFRMDDTLKDLRRKVAVDGFRRGNTPMRIIRRLYGKEAREDVVDKARESIVERVAGEKGLKTVGDVAVLDFTREEGQPVEITMRFEVMPEIEVSADLLTTLEVQAPYREMSEALVDAELERLRQANATYEAKAEGAAFEKGDGALLDVYVTDERGSNLPDYSRFDEFLPEPEKILPPSVAEALIGKKPGEAFDVKAEMKENDGKTPGQVFTYHVELKGVKSRRVPALDDDFAKDLGEQYETLEALKTAVRDEIAGRIEAGNRTAALDAALTAILEKVPFAAPKTLVMNVTADRVERDEEQFKKYGLSLRQIFGSRMSEYIASATKTAEQTVKRYLVLKAIGDRENMEVTEEELMAEFERLGKEAGRSALAIRAQFEARKKLEDLRADLRARKVEDFILQRVKIVRVAPKPEGEAAESGEKPAAAAPAAE